MNEETRKPSGQRGEFFIGIIEILGKIWGEKLR